MRQCKPGEQAHGHRLDATAWTHVLTCVAVACVFCDRLTAGGLVAENSLAAAFTDAFPLNPGHCLIVPRRHEPDFFALTPEEQAAGTCCSSMACCGR